MQVFVNPGGDGGMQRAPESAGLFGGRDFDGASGHVRINLEQQFVFLRKPAARDDFIDGDSFGGKRLDNSAGSIRGRFDERAINFVRLRPKFQSEERARKIGIDEKAAAIPPIEREQTAFTRNQFRGGAFQLFVRITARREAFDEPRKGIADARLACRACEALELPAHADGKALLTEWASGPADAARTREARASLRRLAGKDGEGRG